MPRACLLTITTLWFVLASPVAMADEADRLLGVWATEPTETGYAHVQMARDGDRFGGTIVWLDDPLFPDSEGPAWAGKPKVDRHHPDASKNGRPIIGLELAWGFRYKGNNRWTGGRIYDPENGKTYKCNITLKGDRLEVRGYIGVSLLGRTTTWRAVSADQAAAAVKAPNEGTKENRE